MPSYGMLISAAIIDYFREDICISASPIPMATQEDAAYLGFSSLIEEYAA